jgi:hypothetical protein
MMHDGCNVLRLLCCQPFRRNIWRNAHMWLTTVLMRCAGRGT